MEEDTFKTYAHYPPHLFVASGKYFITGSTYLKKPFLKNDEAKGSLLHSIKKGFDDKEWNLEEWFILDNHYQIML
jgi:REP element-mobilizing transposase RayT